MMGLTDRERTALVRIGAVALVGIGVLLWQRRQTPLTVSGSPAPARAALWDEALRTARSVDVNMADAAALERLPGVGKTLASRIVAYRDEHGHFSTLEELSRVPGIGPKTQRRLEAYVTVQE